MSIADLLVTSIYSNELMLIEFYEETTQAMSTHRQHNDDSLYPEATRLIILLMIDKDYLVSGPCIYLILLKHCCLRVDSLDWHVSHESWTF